MKKIFSLILLLTIAFNIIASPVELYFIETRTYPQMKRMVVYSKHGNIWKVHIESEPLPIFIDITCYIVYDKDGKLLGG
ncbi:hypothetical protein LCGC14_0305980 [marine sediment metagenome]|uniref:Uncharacterized protein n=1 Tax=marine sediment metagenome TaxID=412755 RepID=A0A0F9TTY4_9ZZZZ